MGLEEKLETVDNGRQTEDDQDLVSLLMLIYDLTHCLKKKTSRTMTIIKCN